FADLGPEKSGGTAQFSVSGHVEKPANLELPMGIPFTDLLELAGGVWKGRKLKAVIPGGSSTPVMTADQIMNCTMDYTSLQEAGSAFGTGAVMVMDETTCMVRVLRRISRFYMAESCGQCTPCREGTGWLYRMLTRIIDGQGQQEDIDKLVAVANKIEGHTICALGDAAAWPVQSFIKHFRHEFEYMVQNHGRSVVDETASVAA
ncbi:MAG: NADH-ubiquinone oxidoreductase-F iron-sulfur binding region domain-containing protein, partial [Woeseia sp.]